MSCKLSIFPSYQVQFPIENRLRSNSSSSSTEQIFFDILPSFPKSSCPKKVQNIILTNSLSSQSTIPISQKINSTPTNKQIQDDQMDNLNLFLKILSQIHEQEQIGSNKNEESVMRERKRELRKQKIQRYREKKQARKWNASVRYEVRKNIAKTRLRIKGRFVRE